jgi:hypothetical protein
MMTHSTAPVSLALTSDAREEMLHACRQLERNLQHTLRMVEGTKQCDPQWLAAARMDLNKGLMCLVRSVTRQDFF